MIYLGVVVGLIIMSAMVYLAIDKKSNFPTRVASLAALALMVVTIIICVFIIFTDDRVPVDPSVLIVGAPVETAKEENNNFWVILLLIIFLIGIFILVAFFAMKENKKHAKKLEESFDTSNKFDF